MLGQANSNASEAHTGGAAATVHSCRQSGPQHADEDVQSYGANSPRAARSQISTAVSFEGAKPAGSAAVAARSVEEDSAHSVADPEGENSSMPAEQPQSQHFLAQPTTSLLSTAVRNGSPPPRAAGSPDLYRANSLVSYTEAGQQARAGRAGTPVSVYAQGRVLPTPGTRPSSPQASRAGEQLSGSGEARQSVRSSRRLQAGRGSRSARRMDVQTSQSRPAAGSQQPDVAVSRHTSLLAPPAQAERPPMSPRQASPPAENNSIEAVQRGDSQDGQGGGFGSAEGPMRRHASCTQAESVAQHRQPTSRAVLRPDPCSGSNARNAVNQAVLNVHSAIQGLRTASALMEAATSRAQSEATAPAVPLQHQSAAVLGSGLLTYPPPAAQQHNPGPATDRSQRPRPALSELPRPTGGCADHRALHLLQLPRPDMWPQGMGQSFLDGDSPQHSRRERQHSVAGPPGTQEQQVSADEAHWDPKPQQATRQDLDEGAALPTDAEMTGPSHPAAVAHPPEPDTGAREASPSRLADVSLPARASSNSGADSGGRSQQQVASAAALAGSALAQLVGNAPWEGHAPQAADSGWNGQPAAAVNVDSFEQEAPQPANSVLGTLVNEDAVSDMDNDNDNDVKSLQPSLSQGSLGRPRAAAPGEPSHHGSVLQTASATSEPAMAVATDVPGGSLTAVAAPGQAHAWVAGAQAGTSVASPWAHLARGQAEGEVSVALGAANSAFCPPAFLAAAMQGPPSAQAADLVHGKHTVPECYDLSQRAHRGAVDLALGPAAALQAEDGQSAGLPPLHPGTSDRATSKHTGQASGLARWTRAGSPGATAHSQMGGSAAGDSHASGGPVLQPQQSSGSQPSAEGHSGGFPATATVKSGLEAAPGGHETVAQSQSPANGQLSPPGPQPALTIVMQGGLLGPISEPDDGAAGPTGVHSKQATSNGRISEHSSANGKPNAAVTSPSPTPSGRPKRKWTSTGTSPSKTSFV